MENKTIKLGKAKCIQQLTNNAECFKFIEMHEKLILHSREILQDVDTKEIEYSEWKPVKVFTKSPTGAASI